MARNRMELARDGIRISPDSIRWNDYEELTERLVISDNVVPQPSMLLMH